MPPPESAKLGSPKPLVLFVDRRSNAGPSALRPDVANRHSVPQIGLRPSAHDPLIHPVADNGEQLVLESILLSELIEQTRGWKHGGGYSDPLTDERYPPALNAISADSRSPQKAVRPAR